MGEFADMAMEDALAEKCSRTGERTDLKCGDCGAKLVLRTGKFGRFYGCSRFAETSCRGSVGAGADGTPLGIPGDRHTRDLRRRIMTELDQAREKSVILTAMETTGLDPLEFRGVGYLNAEECEKILFFFGRVSSWDRLDSL